MLKIGLVLAGGGGKGAYQIGVWKALKELGIDKYISVVAGTSIGALNGVLFCEGSYEKAERVWLNLTTEKILPLDKKELRKKGIFLYLGTKNLNLVKKVSPKALEQGNISREGLLDILEDNVDLNKIIKGSKVCYAACSELPDLNAKYFRLNDYDEDMAKKILCASSAIPLIYESEEIDCKKYLDGGIAALSPIQPVYGEGCNIIFVVHLSRNLYIDRRAYPGAKIIEIIPKEEPGGIIDGLLDFSRPTIEKRIKEGYEDAMNLIEPIMEITKMQLQNKPLEVMDSVGKKIINKSSTLKNYILEGISKNNKNLLDYFISKKGNNIEEKPSDRINTQKNNKEDMVSN